METVRCEIELMNREHYKEVRQLYSDKLVRQFLGGPRLLELSSFEEMLTCKEDLYWIISLKQTNEFIGLVSLDTHHDSTSKELSYQFLPQYWGNGYAYEVLGYIIDFIFNDLLLDKIVCEIQAANQSSCKLLTKLGMSVEETVTRFGAKQSIYSLKRVEFLKH